MYEQKYIDREKSWLAFNARVLQEAADNTVPLLDRLRFVGIFSNNLDEFFRVRYAAIRRLSLSGISGEKYLGGVSAQQLIKDITEIRNIGIEKLFAHIVLDPVIRCPMVIYPKEN